MVQEIFTFLQNLPHLALNSGNVVFRMILALIVGVLIGANNETHSQAVSVRTHVLIALGSAIFMITSTWIYDVYGIAVKADPARIGAQVVSGIGFLGAGAIIKYGFSVRGLTTAASIWVTAALGLAAGAGYVWLCVAGSALVYVTLWLLLKLEKHIFNYYQLFVLKISTDSELDDIFLNNLFSEFSIYLKSREIEFNKAKSTYDYFFIVSLSKNFPYETFHQKMASFNFIYFYSIKQ